MGAKFLHDIITQTAQNNPSDRPEGGRKMGIKSGPKMKRKPRTGERPRYHKGIRRTGKKIFERTFGEDRPTGPEAVRRVKKVEEKDPGVETGSVRAVLRSQRKRQNEAIKRARKNASRPVDRYSEKIPLYVSPKVQPGAKPLKRREKVLVDPQFMQDLVKALRAGKMSVWDAKRRVEMSDSSPARKEEAKKALNAIGKVYGAAQV